MPIIGEIRKATEIGRKGRHSYIWQACEDCGIERWTSFRRNRPLAQRCSTCGRKASGKTRKGPNSYHWKGGRRITTDGYIAVYLPPGDFFSPMATNNQVLEHRLVMARHLKRWLLPWEIVHHKDGIKDHNDLANLQLISGEKYHIVDAEIKRYIKRLEREIHLLRLENEQLKGGDTTCMGKEPSQLRIRTNTREKRLGLAETSPGRGVKIE